MFLKSLLVIALASAASLSFAAGVYTSGHGDVRPYYEDGQLQVRYQLDQGSIVDGAEIGTVGGGPVSFAPGSLVNYIPDAPVPMPDLPQYAFIGANVDDPLWFVPEVQEYDRPWLGLSTEELSFGDWAGDAVQMSLVSVTGPAGGYFSLYDSGDGDTPRVYMATSDGIDANDQYFYQGGNNYFPGLRVSTHAHMNWMFTQPGEYELLFKFSGEHLTDGYKEVSAPVTFAVAVVPEPTSFALLALGGGGVLAWRRKSRR